MAVPGGQGQVRQSLGARASRPPNEAESVKQVTKRIGKGWARQMGLKEAEFLSVSLLSRYDKAYAQNADTKYIGWTPHLSRQKAYKSLRIKKRFLLMRALTSNWKTSLPNMPDCPSVYVDVQVRRFGSMAVKFGRDVLQVWYQHVPRVVPTCYKFGANASYVWYQDVVSLVPGYDGLLVCSRD
eukprot:277398-Rhodomonas_salina.1